MTDTLLSMIEVGYAADGLWGTGNLSELPELGGPAKADKGRRGKELGPLRRAPTPGEGGT